MSNSETPHGAVAVGFEPPTSKRLERKLNVSAYLCGTFTALAILPIVVFCIFELAARKQATDFLRFELDKTRAQISENATFPSRGLSNDSNADAANVNEIFVLPGVRRTRQDQLAELETVLEDNLRQISEIAIRGAECYKKTVHVLVNQSFSAAEDKTASELIRIELDGLRRRYQRTQDLIAEEKASRDSGSNAEELGFLSKHLGALQEVTRELERLLGPVRLVAKQPDSSSTERYLEDGTASDIRALLAGFSASLGTIEGEFPSARIANSLDRKILRLLGVAETGGVVTDARYEISEALDLVDSARESRDRLVERRSDLQQKAKEATDRIAAFEGDLDDLGAVASRIVNEATAANRTKRAECDPNGAQLLYTCAETKGETLSNLPVWSKLAITCWLSPVLTIPSPILYALSVILSGATGAVFIAIYFRLPDVFSRLFLGAVSGLVALLVLKGGKFLFIMDFGLVSQDNPYAGAFAGILAGLFTDRGFRLMENLVESAISKVHETQGTSEPDEDEPTPDNSDTVADDDDAFLDDENGDTTKAGPPAPP